MQQTQQEFSALLEEYKAHLQKGKLLAVTGNSEDARAYRKERNRLYHQIRKSQFPEKIREQKRKTYYKHREAHLKNMRARASRMKSANNEYRKRKLFSDPSFRISQGILCRLNECLRFQKRSRKMHSLIGISLENFKKHLESQFRDGMNWDNRGKIWHVDHIKPRCQFDHTNEDQKKECWHYSNMRPVLAEENRKKNRY